MFKFSTIVKELRFFLSQSGEASAPLKEYLVSNYPKLKTQNPNIPIAIRESIGVPPSLIVRYQYGEERKTNLDGMDIKGIEQAVSQLAK